MIIVDLPTPPAIVEQVRHRRHRHHIRLKPIKVEEPSTPPVTLLRVKITDKGGYVIIAPDSIVFTKIYDAVPPFNHEDQK